MHLISHIILPLTFLHLCTAAFTAISNTGADYHDLGGSSWKFKNANGSLTSNATVPGLIHTDLYAAGIIPDPRYGGNFALDEWIAYDNWIYTRSLPLSFPLGKPWSTYQKLYLVFEGLDTAATIFLGGKQVGFANNQFRQWTFDVSGYINGSDMDLEVRFESAVTYSQAVFEETGSPWKKFMNYEDFLPNGREYMRKVQSDFGWDWGPHFAPQGVYRDVYLVGLDDGAYITNSHVDIYKAGQRPNTIANQSAPWVVNVSVDYLAANTGVTPTLSVGVAGFNASSTTYKTVSGRNVAEMTFNISERAVERWWPAEFGEPKLYNMSISLEFPASNGSSTTTVSYTKKTGFRTIVLDLTPYSDRPGNHFSFMINGQCFNVKGRNMVPMDPFEPRVDSAWYRRLYESAIASNFNMIRVWSSGNYYSDEFYSVADELGILWSEFQFSDNYYPVFPEFLDNVKEEAVYQMRRLNSNPSLALWCDGNENEGFNIQQLFKNATYGESWFKNYTILTEETLWPTVYQNTRSLSWIQASNSQGYSVDNPDTGVWINRYGLPSGYSNPYYGPAEDYNLDINQVFNNSLVPATRFTVEFGALSYDSLESYQTVLPNDSIRTNDSTLLSRCYDGSSTVDQDIALALSRYLTLPNRTDPLTQFSQFAWSTQIYHASIMKFQIEAFRRSISLPENNLGA